MAFTEQCANLDKHLQAIVDAEEKERLAMVHAEAETRMATRRWRQYNMWLQKDSVAKGLPRGGHTRRLAKAKLVWWASKRADGWRGIDRV